MLSRTPRAVLTVPDVRRRLRQLSLNRLSCNRLKDVSRRLRGDSRCGGCQVHRANLFAPPEGKSVDDRSLIMDGLYPFESMSDGPLPDPGVPRRLLRHIFEGCLIGVGSRILDVGCGTGELMRFLDQLCLDVSGLDDSPENIQATKSACPTLTCLYGAASEPLPFPGHHFNLVLARDLSVHTGDLLGRTALSATARLLAAVRPGGALCLIRRQPHAVHAARSHFRDHADECFRRHLDTFATDVRITHIGDTWNWMARFGPKSRYVMAQVEVPLAPRSLNEWLSIAQRGASRRTAACCNMAGGENRAASPRRRVA
jgi:SAM-dependent methyltransferase